jgi:hypothetical protein
MGVILRFNGSSWSSVTPDAAVVHDKVRGVYGVSATNVHVVGNGGTFVRWDGSAFSAESNFVTSKDMMSVWGASAEDVWAVGQDGTIAHFDGAHWSAAARPHVGDAAQRPRQRRERRVGRRGRELRRRHPSL